MGGQPVEGDEAFVAGEFGGLPGGVAAHQLSPGVPARGGLLQQVDGVKPGQQGAGGGGREVGEGGRGGGVDHRAGVQAEQGEQSGGVGRQGPVRPVQGPGEADRATGGTAAGPGEGGQPGLLVGEFADEVAG